MNTKQQGIAMLEVLITIAVIAFGFLSLAMFQIGSLKHLSGTHQNMAVTTLVDSLGDSIRANKLNSLDYDGINTRDFTKNCDGQGVTCKSFERDVYRFKKDLTSAGVSDAEADIQVTNTVATISVSWVEKSTHGILSAEEKQVYKFQVRL